MLDKIIILVVFTLLPFLELRASIPYGILVLRMPWLSVFIICVITNIFLAPIVFVFLDRVVHLFLRIKHFNNVYYKHVTRTQKRIKRYVDRFGELGIAIFIGIPLPGSGVYSGALGAYILGMKFKNFLKSAIIGILIAGVIVTLASLAGNTFVS